MTRRKRRALGLTRAARPVDDVELPADLVPHPRYGAAPRRSGLSLPDDLVRECWGGWRDERFFPATALQATASGGYWRTHGYYVDVLKTCETCHRHFVFFAREQRFWYETLRAHRHAEPRGCVPCRGAARARQARLLRWERASHASRLSVREMLALVDDAAALCEDGVLRRPEVLGALKNRAFRQCGESVRIDRLVRAIAGMRPTDD
jgi:Probable zinc-ribbon domain